MVPLCTVLEIELNRRDDRIVRARGNCESDGLCRGCLGGIKTK